MMNDEFILFMILFVGGCLGETWGGSRHLGGRCYFVLVLIYSNGMGSVTLLARTKQTATIPIFSLLVLMVS